MSANQNENNNYSSSSTQTSSMTLSCDDNSGIAVLNLHYKPANVFTWHFMTELRQQLSDIQTNQTIRALIITSSLKSFIAGADINEFYSRKRVYYYIKKFEDTCLALYNLTIPTIAAINGDAIAGGCVIGNACDYRFIAKSALFGLNGAKIGLTLPYFVHYWPTQILGQSRGTRVCTEANLLTAEEAFNIGWVDGIADDVSQLMSMANSKAEQLIKIPGIILDTAAYSSIKKMSRLEFEEKNAKYGEKQLLEFVEIACSDTTNAILGDVLKSISSKKS